MDVAIVYESLYGNTRSVAYDRARLSGVRLARLCSARWWRGARGVLPRRLRFEGAKKRRRPWQK
jgi:hypothetical protein